MDVLGGHGSQVSGVCTRLQRVGGVGKERAEQESSCREIF